MFDPVVMNAVGILSPLPKKSIKPNLQGEESNSQLALVFTNKCCDLFKRCRIGLPQ